MFHNLYNRLNIMWRCLIHKLLFLPVEIKLTPEIWYSVQTCDGRIRRKKDLGDFWKAVFLPWLCLRWYHKIISKAWKWQRHLIYTSALMIWFNPCVMSPIKAEARSFTMVIKKYCKSPSNWKHRKERKVPKLHSSQKKKKKHIWVERCQKYWFQWSYKTEYWIKMYKLEEWQ